MRINGSSPDFFAAGRTDPRQNSEVASKLAYLQVALTQKRSKGGDVAAELRQLNQARIALNRGDAAEAERIASSAFSSVDIPQKAGGGDAAAGKPAAPAGARPSHGATEGASGEEMSTDDGGSTYQDASGDSSVSFKAPTHLSPEAAEYWVRAHEGEHVIHETARAAIEGRDVVNVAVRIYYRYSARAKKAVPAGGSTYVFTKERYRPKQAQPMEFEPADTASSAVSYNSSGPAGGAPPLFAQQRAGAAYQSLASEFRSPLGGAVDFTA